MPPRYLNPTPPERLCDASGRPYFLWDVDMTLETFLERLDDPDEDVAAYFLGKLMRQAKPDDVLQWVKLPRIAAAWDKVESYLGQSRDLWRWLIASAPHAA